MQVNDMQFCVCVFVLRVCWKKSQLKHTDNINTHASTHAKNREDILTALILHLPHHSGLKVKQTLARMERNNIISAWVYTLERGGGRRGRGEVTIKKCQAMNIFNSWWQCGLKSHPPQQALSTSRSWWQGNTWLVTVQHLTGERGKKEEEGDW